MSRLESVLHWSLRRPRLVACIALWAAICAGYGLQDLKFDLLPDLAPAQLTIETEAPGFVAEQVEQTVTRPLESALMGAPGVDRVRSRSIQGLSVITVSLTQAADPLKVRQVLVGDLARAGALPPGVSAPRVPPLSSAGQGVLKLGFTSDTLSPMDLRDIVQWTVRPRLLSTPGVGRVGIYGGQIRRIEVQARPGDLSDSDLGFLDILNATRRATSVAGAGFIDTPNQRVQIEPHGQALTLDEVRAGQIQTPGADPVRIDDVADVAEVAAPSFGDALIDGRPGVLLTLDQQLGANSLETTRAVDKVLATLEPSLKAQGVQVSADIDRPAGFIAAALKSVLIDLLVGLALAAVLLALLMRDLRAVAISILTIPLTFLTALLVLALCGWTLNAMTLGGLAVALGLVIDDAVLDVENILATLREAEQRHASRLQAVLSAALEIRGPVAFTALPVAATLTPLLFLKGAEGALLAPLACAIIVALAASLVIALTVTPALCLLLLNHIRPETEHPLFTRVSGWHAAGLRRIGARPRLALAIAATLVLAAGLTVLSFRQTLLPSLHNDHLLVQVDAPVATPPDVVRDLGQRIAQDLAKVSGVRAISEQIGRDVTGDDATPPEDGRFDVALTPGLSGHAQVQVAQAIIQRLTQFPGLHPIVRSRFDALQAGDADAAPVRIGVYGPDMAALDAAGAKVAAALGGIKGVGDVSVSGSDRAPTVRVDLNFSRLALYGLSAADVLDTIQAAFAGETVAQIYDGPRVVDLAISAQNSLRQDPEAVGDLLVRSTSGFALPLKSVANVYLTDGRAMIAHDNGLRVQWIEAQPKAADQARVLSQVKAVLAQPGLLPPGVFAEFARADPLAGVGRALAIRYALAAFAIFALLAVAYDAPTAGLVLTSALFAFVGGVAAVALSGGVMSVGAVVGFITLLGLSIRSAVLLISQAEDQVLNHRAPWSMDTLIFAARDRAASLVTTALLVAAVIAPLALQGGRAGMEILGPLAVVVLGGLLAGTVGNLLLLPTLMFAVWRPGYGHRRRAAPPPAAILRTEP